MISPVALVIAGGHAAVDQQRRPGDEVRLVACVEDRRRGDVAGLADPADRRNRPVTGFRAVRLSRRGQVPHPRPGVPRAQDI
jgi:hypothetical protein